MVQVTKLAGTGAFHIGSAGPPAQTASPPTASSKAQLRQQEAPARNAVDCGGKASVTASGAGGPGGEGSRWKWAGPAPLIPARAAATVHILAGMTYLACPKCHHRPLPTDQALPAQCPACGLVLAKARARASGGLSPAGAGSRGRPAADAPAPSWPDEERVSPLDWNARRLLLAAFVLWTFYIWRDVDLVDGKSGSPVLHLVLLPFHEAGHYLLFRWFGEFMMILGGTLGQHLLPVVAGVHFLWWQRNRFAAALALWLLGYSLIDMSVYMFDALEPQLTLLDGMTGHESGGHDWINLFDRLGLLRHAQAIGWSWAAVGVAVMAGALLWAAAELWQQRRKLGQGF